MHEMLALSKAEQANIIQVNGQKSLIRHTSAIRKHEIATKRIIHHVLECRRGTTQTHRHDFELKVAIRCCECSFRNILSTHSYLIITVEEIKFGKVSRTRNAFEQVRYSRQPVCNAIERFAIELDIADAHTPRTFTCGWIDLFGNEQDRRCPW